MNLTIITGIIGLLNNILQTVKKITSFIKDYKQNKDIKKKYEEDAKNRHVRSSDISKKTICSSRS